MSGRGVEGRDACMQPGCDRLRGRSTCPLLESAADRTRGEIVMQDFPFLGGRVCSKGAAESVDMNKLLTERKNVR